MEYTKEDLNDIKESLWNEYSPDEVIKMLSGSKILKNDEGVFVYYDNGVVDKFVYVKKLVHISKN